MFRNQFNKTQKMASQKFKYNINHQISLMPRHISIDSLVKILSNEHGITRDTFYRDRNLTLVDTFSIPSDRMDIYAALFNCTVDDLKNFTSKKIKPLADRKLSKTQKAVVKACKMVKGAAKLIALAFLLSSCASYAGLGKCTTNKYTPIHVRR